MVVHISAPKKTKLESIKMFALTKLNWIKKQQAKMLKKPAKKDYTISTLKLINLTKYF